MTISWLTHALVLAIVAGLLAKVTVSSTGSLIAAPAAAGATLSMQ